MSTVLFPELTTERLLLRQMVPADAEAIFRLRTDKEVNKFIKMSAAKNKENGSDFVARMEKEFASQISINWAISLKNDHRLIGSICLWNFSGDHRQAEIGYSLFTDFHKQGIMSEAISEVVHFGFYELSLKNIEAFTQKDNISSIKLLEKHGFSKIQTRVDPHNPKNHIYSKTNPEL